VGSLWETVMVTLEEELSHAQVRTGLCFVIEFYDIEVINIFFMGQER
jgi:hypothetical protein